MGEYSIISGSKAMVMPLPQFSGELILPDRDLPAELEAEQSNYELREFFQYLDSRQVKGQLSSELDTCRLGSDLDLGLFFQSTIPVQYGAGSSAALVAAVYGAYSYNTIDRGTARSSELLDLRLSLGEMESCFHGTSSGIDPLCSYTGKTLIVDQDNIRPIRIAPLQKDEKLFLLDCGLKSHTGSLVSDFKSRMDTDKEFGRAVREDLGALVERGIMGLSGEANENTEKAHARKSKEAGGGNSEEVNGGKSEEVNAGDRKEFPAGEDLKELFRELSKWQLENFLPMIPDEVRPIWEEGLNTAAYSLKLCGSGGGGFFLGYTGQWKETLTLLGTSGMKVFALDL